MDRLPVELISVIIRGLQQSNVSDGPLDRLTETTQEGVDGWLIHTVASRRDICNFRLVSRKFYNSSFPSFGETLGDRVFRITQTGLEDLFAIASTTSLRPHVRKLTLGTFRSDEVTIVRDLLKSLPEPHRTRLRASYTDDYRWHRSHRASLQTQDLAQLLRRLSNLRNVRILLLDSWDMINYLGEWLDPGIVAIVARELPKSTSTLSVTDDNYKLRTTDLLTCLAPVFDALKSTKTVLQDLGFGLNNAPAPNELFRTLDKINIASSLRHLRLPMNPAHLMESGSFYYSCLIDTFQALSDITHLTLSMVQVTDFEYCADAMDHFLDLLRPMGHLQYLTIRGTWWYSEDQLLDFVASRGAELILFSLKDPVMHAGSWSSTVSRLAHLQPGNLRYFEACAMSTSNLSGRDLTDPIEDLDWKELLTAVEKPVEQWATCSVYLSCSHHKYFFEPVDR
ncbi:hypothetical protein HBH70_185460 [Parastagonospora nodorum]|nr:hypothetical protein HBH70_185460 [Parastagonospora nodorum]KAH5710941.1 hypothetical protein HBI20_176250 [Parastagonospora nodorum]